MDTPISNDAPLPPGGAAGERSTFRWYWGVLLLVVSLIPTVWIGDVSFIADEPKFIAHAINANHARHWAELGLTGNQGRPYGPGAIWIYQVGLRLANDPITLGRYQAFAFTAITLGSLAWIAWLANIHPVWVLMIGGAPYLMHSARTFWDHSIPLAGVVAAGSLHVIGRRAIWPLPLVTAVSILMMLNHPMAIALIGGMVVAVAWLGWRAFVGRRWWSYVIHFAVVIALVAWAWFGTARLRAVWMAPPLEKTMFSSEPNGWWFPLLSPRVLSAVWIDYSFPPQYLDEGDFSSLLAVARAASAGMFVLAWAGAVIALRSALRPRSMLITAGLAALLVLIAQSLLDGLTHTYGHPHYYYATWVAPAILVAVSLEWLRQRRPRVGLTVAAAMLITQVLCTGLIALRIHTTGGTRFEEGLHMAGYGPTLQNEIDVARTSLLFPASVNVRPMIDTPLGALAVLSQWPPRRIEESVRLKASALELRYAHPSDPFDGRIELVPQP